MPRWVKDAPAREVRVGDRATVPLSRMVRAMPPHAVRPEKSGGPYREEERVERLNVLPESHAIRPGGTMTVFTFLGGPPRSLLKVVYRANPAYRGEQCPSGHWFDIPEEEFLRMKRLTEELREQEDLERAVVVSLLRSL